MKTLLAIVVISLVVAYVKSVSEDTLIAVGIGAVIVIGFVALAVGLFHLIDGIVHVARGNKD